VHEIVAGAGATTATFYRYFKSKEEVYYEIVNTFLTRYIEAWSGIYSLFNGEKKDPEQALEIVGTSLRSIFAFYRDNRDMASVIFRRVIPVDDRFADQSQALVDMTFQNLEEIVAALRPAGMAGQIEPRVGAAVTIGAVFGVALECIVEDGREDVDSLAEQVVAIMRGGVMGQA
ncbi:MAG: TetR/AcrR family transcriptional regulator, partial [Candidatus Geothermincolia bacterium]